jgi:putative hydrolase of the HAD superfamily
MGSIDESAASFPAVPRPLPAPPKAVLLDVGGVFLVPTHDRIMGAFARAGFTPSVGILDRAHYAGALTFPFTADETIDWATRWRAYLDGYMTECGTPDEMREDVHQHLDSEFADAALWLREFPGSRDGLRELAATGVRLGIISNADGLIGGRLAEAEILQVGPGLGVAVECVIDSGAVGVMKPDPRIFRLALDAMDIAAADAWYVGDMPGIDVIGARAAGLHPVLMDPYELHLDADYDRIGSLSELAKIVGSE